MIEEEILLDSNIDSWIEKNRGQFVTDIINLVNIQSVAEIGIDKFPYGSGCAEVLVTALNMMKRYGFITINDNFHYGIAYKEKKKNKYNIGIFNHLDVVPAGDDWSFNPFEASEKDGFIIGRGSEDNKGPAMAAFYALKYLEEKKLLNNNFFIYLGCCEESGMKDLDYYLEKNKEPDLSLVPDAVFPVCYGEKGIIQIELQKEIRNNDIMFIKGGKAINIVPAYCYAKIKNKDKSISDSKYNSSKIKITKEKDIVNFESYGIAKHSAFPENSINAIKVLLDSINFRKIVPKEIEKELKFINSTMNDFNGVSIDVPFKDEISGSLTHVLTKMDISDQKIKLFYDIRYPVKSDGNTIIDIISDKFSDHGYKILNIIHNPSSVEESKNEIVEKLTIITNEILHTHFRPYIMGGGTYARKLNNGFGFGMGIQDNDHINLKTRGGAHQPDEKVKVDVLLKGIKIYIKSLKFLDKYIDTINLRKK